MKVFKGRHDGGFGSDEGKQVLLQAQARFLTRLKHAYGLIMVAIRGIQTLWVSSCFYA